MEEVKQIIDLKVKLRDSRQERTGKSRALTNVSRNTININQNESQILASKQYKNKLSIYDNRKQSQQVVDKSPNISQEALTSFETHNV